MNNPASGVNGSFSHWRVRALEAPTFRCGEYVTPYLPADNLVNDDVMLPEAVRQSFWLDGAAWQFPDFDNVETFVERLVRHEVLVSDPVVHSVLQERSQSWSSRTVRRRFLRATGLTPTTIQQVERANQAVALLSQGVPILDAVYQAGYADQPHMTRALRRFVGQTPAQIARLTSPLSPLSSA